jgi:hypothetical protein
MTDPTDPNIETAVPTVPTIAEPPQEWPPPQARCASCRFSKEVTGGRECHRRPPTAEGWPTVADDDWCGEIEM